MCSLIMIIQIYTLKHGQITTWAGNKRKMTLLVKLHLLYWSHSLNYSWGMKVFILCNHVEMRKLCGGGGKLFPKGQENPLWTSPLPSLCLHFLLSELGGMEAIRTDQLLFTYGWLWLMSRSCPQCCIQEDSVVSQLSQRVCGNGLAMSALGTRWEAGRLCVIYFPPLK